MKINLLSISILSAALSIMNFASANSNSENDHFHGSLAMLGSSHLHYNPVFMDQVSSLFEKQQVIQAEPPNKDIPRHLRKNFKKGKNSKKGKHSKKGKKSKKSKNSKKGKPCDPADINLNDFPQWQEERGYWIGSYTFLGSDGQPYTSGSWNYPYASYKGFITGDIDGNAYSQRNVFLYPPQDTDICEQGRNETVGEGTCGVNGNTKIFSADQEVTICTEESKAGSIDGLYQGLPTKTQLIGQDNALLYQVFFPAGDEQRLLQSQLTTITENTQSGQIFRTRSAQGFEFLGFQNELGSSTSSSYYQERKVDETEFWEEFQKSIDEYNIRSDDLCKYDSSGKNATMTGSIEACRDHLNESFFLKKS